MVLSLISSSCTLQFLVEERCLIGQDSMILTESTVSNVFYRPVAIVGVNSFSFTKKT